MVEDQGNPELPNSANREVLSSLVLVSTPAGVSRPEVSCAGKGREELPPY